MSKDTWLQEMRAWHEQKARSTIEEHFALGDMLHKGVIHLELSVDRVIKLLQVDLGELALSRTIYCRDELIARTFTLKQREVLVSKLVPVWLCASMCWEPWTPEKRTAIIAKIKEGRIKSPWRQIESVSGKVRRVAKHELPADSSKNPDNIVLQIGRDGNVEDESVINVFKNIISRIGKYKTQLLWEIAESET